MNTNTRIGIASVSGYVIGGLVGYLLSRKFHKKEIDQVADEIVQEMLPTMFQSMTMMFTGLEDMALMDFTKMDEEEVMNAYQKILSDGFEFFNMTMKDKYGVTMQLEIHREPREED